MFCLMQVKTAYINFLNHCYVDTEVEMKEIYTSRHMWTLFENFLVDMAMVRRLPLPLLPPLPPPVILCLNSKDLGLHSK